MAKTLDTRSLYWFEALDRLKERGLTTDRKHYTLMYQAHLDPDDPLDSIYQKFNIRRPSNFLGYSLSISDVVALQRDGQERTHYVDRFGFREIPDFVIGK